MKKQTLLTLLAFFCLVGGSAWAQTFTQGNLKYTVTDADAKTVSVAKASNDITGAIVIPSSVTEGGVKYTVTETAAGAFHNCTGITAMTIPASVVTVKRGFVTNCPALKKLTIQDSSTPLYFQNNYNTYYNGDYQFCLSELDYFYMGRDITLADANKNIVTAAKEIELGGKMTNIPGWFSDENTALTKVTIGGNITKIGREAFDQNTSLTSVTITSPVDTLLQSAFWGCSSLTTFDIPATVKYIGPAVFRNCTALEALTIPAATEHINRGILTGCTGLKKLTIEDSETSLYYQNNYNTYYDGNDELFNAAMLESYYQGRNIKVAVADKHVVNSAKIIKLGGSMTAIPNYFTQGDTALTTLIIGDNITKIGREAFCQNTCLNSVTITAPVDTMLQSAFWGCSALETFKIPATVKYLGPAVFRNCTSLAAISIPSGTEHICRGIFTGCTGLKKLTIEDSDKPLYFQNNYNTYYDGDYEIFNAAELVDYYQGRNITRADVGSNKIVTSAKNIELGGSMTAIPDHFTENDTALTTLIISENITKIGYVAFCGNTRLNSITFNAPVDTIGQSAFYGCTELETIELPSTLKYLGPGAFFNCYALSALTIPAATEYVGRGVLTNCTGLKSLIIEDSNKPLFFKNNYNTYYDGTNELCKSDLDYFYMGRNVDRQEPENILVTSAQKIKVAGNVTALPGYFTKNNKALTEVLVQGDMTKIGYQSFCGCENLTSVTLSAPIDTIRYEAFYGCTALPGIELPEEMKCIERAAFYGCTALSSFTIPAATEYVERGIFTNCTALKSLTIEDSDKPLFFKNNYNTYYNGTNELCTSDLDYFYMGRDVNRTEPENILVTSANKIKVAGNVTAIPGYFTKNNKALTEVLVQGDMTKISYQAFCYCENLTSVTLDAPIDTIRYEAFYGCTALPGIELPEEMKCIERAAFYDCTALSSFTIPSATEYVERGIFTNCTALKSLTIEDSDKPLFFKNNYNTYYSGTNELCTSDLEELYVGRDITQADAARLVSKAQKVTFGEPVTKLSGQYSSISGIAKVVAPWQTPITINSGEFSDATYQSATLFVPGGTINAYKGKVGWSKFLKIEANSYFVTGTATAGGTLKFEGQTVTNGSKKLLVEREKDVVFEVAPEENYDFARLLVNGAAVEVSEGIYTYPCLLQDIEVKAAFTEKPKFDIKATATGGMVSLNGANFSASQTIKVYRDTDVTLAIAANEGYEQPKVTVNGTDVTAQLQDNTLKIENIQEAKTIVVTYTKMKFQIAKQTTQNGSIELSKTVVEWGDSFTATFKPATGYELATASLNNQDVTAQVADNVLTVTNVKENKTVGATFKRVVFNVTISGGGITVSNTNPQYGENVTVTIDDDPDLTLVTLLVNGVDVTAQVVGGQYVIQNVTGDVTIEATFKSTKEFITMTGEYATFSCPQDLDFTSSDLRAYIASGFNKATNQVLLTRVKDVPAGTGVFLVGEPNTTYKIPYSETTSYYVNLFQANLQKTDIPATAGNFSNYIFDVQDSEPGFYPIDGKATLLAQTAYLQLPTSFVAAGVKVSVIFEEDIIDGIEEFRISDEDADIYDLAGRRLGKMQRGINIVNGKKVLVK